MREAEKRRSATRRQAARSSVGAPVDRAHRGVDAVGEQAGDAVLDELGHRSARDTRSPACRTASPRRPRGRTARRRRWGAAGAGGAEDLGALLGPDRPEVGDAVAVDVRLDAFGEVARRPGRSRRSRAGGRRARRSRSPAAVPLSGWIRPKHDERVAAVRGERQRVRRRRRGGRSRRSPAPARGRRSEIETKAPSVRAGRRAGSAAPRSRGWS